MMKKLFSRSSDSALQEAENLRASNRESIGAGVTALAETSDGRILEGVVHDVSDKGARINGPTEGLRLEDKIKIVFVVQADEKVLFHATVKHLDDGGHFYGVQFLNRAQPVDPEYVPAAGEPKPPPQVEEGCPRCGGKLELGYMVDHVHLPGKKEGIVQACWAGGRPSRTSMSRTGTHLPPNRLRADTYRCTSCGHLEFYAFEPQRD